jgi:hypothetical protein
MEPGKTKEDRSSPIHIPQSLPLVALKRTEVLPDGV